MSRILKPITSLARLCWIVAKMLRNALFDLLRRDWQAAAQTTREALLYVHDDILNAIVRVQGALGYRHQSAIDPKSILVVKLDRLGDMVNFTPALDALVENCPRATIDIVGDRSSLGILDDDRRLAERFYYRSALYFSGIPKFFSLGKTRLLWQLLRRRYDLVLISRGSFRFFSLALLSRMACTKFVEGEPVVMRNLKMLEPIFGAQVIRPLSLPDSRDSGIVDESEGSSFVVLHASASALAKSGSPVRSGRMWPGERFAQLADELRERWGTQVHFLCAPSEADYVRGVVETCRYSHAIRHDLSLPQVVQHIRKAELFIGNDSGLAHIAAAVQTPLVVIWGPTTLTMSQPHADMELCRIMYHDVPCRSACREIRCHIPEQFDCIRRTTVSDVLAACEELRLKDVQKT